MDGTWGSLAVVAAVAAIAACGQPFTSAGGDGGADGESVGDAATDHGRIGDAGHDAARDAGDAGPPCDDCSGAAACANVKCELDPGGGWMHVSFEPLGRGTCPEGYDNPVDVVVAGGPPPCGGKCTGGGVTCGGDAGVEVEFGLTGVCNTTMKVIPATGCSKFLLSSGASVIFTPVVPTVAACTVGTSLPAPPETKGRLCALMQAGTGCPMGEACIARTDSLIKMSCVARAGGGNACPAGFARPFSAATATGFVDTRHCSCAATAPAACTNQAVTLFTGAGCTLESDVVNESMSCTMVTSSSAVTFQAARFSATVQGSGCAPSSMPIGTETPKDPMSALTVCCP